MKATPSFGRTSKRIIGLAVGVLLAAIGAMAAPAQPSGTYTAEPADGGGVSTDRQEPFKGIEADHSQPLGDLGGVRLGRPDNLKADADGDGYWDWTETCYGTNPKDANDRPDELDVNKANGLAGHIESIPLPSRPVLGGRVAKGLKGLAPPKKAPVAPLPLTPAAPPMVTHVPVQHANPPPSHASIAPLVIGLGVAGAAALAIGVATAGGGAGGTSYRCREGWSWCATVGKCCQTHNIQGRYGAYYIYGLSKPCVDLQGATYWGNRGHGGTACWDERRN